MLWGISSEGSLGNKKNIVNWGRRDCPLGPKLMEILRDDGRAMPLLPVTSQEGMWGRWGTLGVGTTLLPTFVPQGAVPFQGGQPLAGGTKPGDDDE